MAKTHRIAKLLRYTLVNNDIDPRARNQPLRAPRLTPFESWPHDESVGAFDWMPGQKMKAASTGCFKVVQSTIVDNICFLDRLYYLIESDI
jgi:hypothetical protein